MENNDNLLNVEKIEDKKEYNILMKIWRIIYLPLIYFVMPVAVTFVIAFAFGIYAGINSINVSRTKYKQHYNPKFYFAITIKCRNMLAHKL